MYELSQSPNLYSGLLLVSCSVLPVFPHPFKCTSGFLSNSWCEREHGCPCFLQTLLISLPGSPFCVVSQLRLSEGFYTPTENPICTFWLITCNSLTPWVSSTRVWSNRSLPNWKRREGGTRANENALQFIAQESLVDLLWSAGWSWG